MTEPTDDFFVAGGTLRATDPSYVTRPADHDLLQQLQAGEFCYVLTPRQMGKSSLMVRTAQRLRADGTQVAIVDLTSIGGGSSELSADQWYLGLLSRVRAQLRLGTDVEMWWDEHAALGIAQRFITFLHDVLLAECNEPVVILIDEIDSTLNLDFRDDYFAAIRALYNERATDPIYQRLTFALFGVATPTDLIQDRERTPFNIGRRIDLREFTLEDAQPLRDGLAASFPTQADAILQRIFDWTHGHPYLTQKLCQVLQMEAPADLENDVIGGVDEAVQNTFFSEEGRKDPNLTFVQDRIANSPDGEKRRMLQLYRRVQRGDDVANDDRSPVQNRLELYGLVGVAQGRLQVRNRIYARVFDGAWIGSMMPVDRRQRRAVLAGVGALVLALGVAILLFLQPTPECSVFSEQFAQNEDSNVRLSALASLFEQGDRCRGVALDLFYNLQPDEQKALFLGLDNFPSERNRLVTVIDAIYRTLDTVPDHDVDLMKDWSKALEWAEVEHNSSLYLSINYWQDGRSFAHDGEYRTASVRYQDALDNVSDGNHPALRYDLAVVYIELAEYDKALEQLDAILEAADQLPITPTPTISSTPSISPAVALSTSSDNTHSQTTPFNTVATATASAIKSQTSVNTSAIEIATSNKSPDQYQEKFRNADSVRNAVRTLLEDSSKILLYYQKNRVDYPQLASLANLSLSVTVVKTDPTQQTPPTLTPLPLAVLPGFAGGSSNVFTTTPIMSWSVLPGGTPGEFDGHVFTSVGYGLYDENKDVTIFTNRLYLRLELLRTPSNRPVQFVVFTFEDENFQVVHVQKEMDYPYCSFAGSSDCAELALLPGVRWPSTQLPLANGTYDIIVDVFLQGDAPDDPSGTFLRMIEIAAGGLGGSASE